MDFRNKVTSISTENAVHATQMLPKCFDDNYFFKAPNVLEQRPQQVHSDGLHRSTFLQAGNVEWNRRRRLEASRDPD